eukprot:759906-Hanusia_phi.AAC.2
MGESGRGWKRGGVGSILGRGGGSSKGVGGRGPVEVAKSCDHACWGSKERDRWRGRRGRMMGMLGLMREDERDKARNVSTRGG